MNSRSISKSYDAYYYAHGCGDQPYEHNETWLSFFGSVADRIVNAFRPTTVLDAGCAIGLLVELLRDRGVAAYGIDLSEYAISQVREDIRPFCRTGSLTEPLPQAYDLIVCIEVLEHLSADEGQQAIANLCAHTSEVLFSSTPFDYKEATHLNVRPPDYWAEAFARHGFYRDVDFDATFLTPWAARFRSTRESVERVVAGYERRLWQLEKDNQARRELTIEQRNELAERARRVEELEAARARQVEELEARRARQAEELEAARARQVEELEAARRREVENLVSQIHSLNSQLADLQSLPTTVEELTAKLTEREQEIERLNKLIEMKDGLLPKFKEHELAHLYLDGLQGLEIGPAAHNPFGLNTRNVAPKEDYEIYAAESRRIHGIEPARIDIWAHADSIPVRDQSEDFILSSHVVEHLPNVIAAFIEWNRIVRDSGYVFMIVPLRDAFEGDVSRELTPFEHFIEDYELGLTLDTHPTDGVPGGRMGHYHTFTPEVLLKVVEYMKRKGLCRWEMIAREDIDTKFGNGFTLVFRVRHNT